MTLRLFLSNSERVGALVAVLAAIFLGALAEPSFARTSISRYPIDLYTEARAEALGGDLGEAEKLWRQMLRTQDGPVFAVDLATACEPGAVLEILDKLRRVHPVFSLSEKEAEGSGCRRILFGLFPSSEGMDDLIRHLPAISLYPPTVVQLEDSAESGPTVRDVRTLSELPQGRLPDEMAVEEDDEIRAEAQRLFDEGKVALVSQDLPAAETAFRSVLALEPDNSSAMHNLGIIRMYLKDFDEAARLFAAVIERDPTYMKAHLNLATAYFGQGDSERAIEILENALPSAPANFDFLYTLAGLCAESGRFEEAHSYIDRALQVDPQNPRALALAEALPSRDASSQPPREAATPRVNTTVPTGARLREPKVDGAGDRFGAPHPVLPPEPIKREMPTEAERHFRLAVQAYEKGDLRQAEREYRAAAELDPANPNIFNNLGAIYMDQGRQSAAVEAFRSALSADPEHLKARINLGGVLYNQGSRKEAVQILQEAEALAPSDPELLYALSLLLAHQGEREEARQRIQRAIQVAPFDPKIRALEDALASSLERMYVAEPEIFLRQDPSRSSGVVGKIQFGESLDVLQRSAGWVRVRVTDDGTEGWVVDGMLSYRAPAS